MAQLQTYAARLVRATPLTEWTKHLEFEMQNVPSFGFVPGQWLSVKHTLPNGEELIRPYSMCSAPPENGAFAFCLNRVSEGHMSNFLCDMKPGEEISCQGPFGSFILRPPLRDTVFIATGTGIAPIRSMLHWLLADEARHENKQFWLLFGSRTRRDIYYHDEFVELAATHSNFHYMPTLSRGSDSWTGLRGYVQEHVKAIVGERKDMHAYICGLAKMVKANRDLLSGMGWERKSILYERYD
jgi:ferredoxin-NADP reductase